jgi:hypothetical protein
VQARVHAIPTFEENLLDASPSVDARSAHETGTPGKKARAEAFSFAQSRVNDGRGHFDVMTSPAVKRAMIIVNYCCFFLRQIRAMIKRKVKTHFVCAWSWVLRVEHLEALLLVDDHVACAMPSFQAVSARS